MLKETQKDRDSLGRFIKGHSRKLSEETRKKMSEVRRGRKFTEEHRRKISKTLMGRKHSEESKKKMRGIHNGENHWNWKGGVSRKYKEGYWSVEYKEWRKKVFERDNYTCVKCGFSEGRILNAHHIKNFSDYSGIRFELNNGIAFCEKCHDVFHKKYGRRNNTKKQLEEFLKG